VMPLSTWRVDSVLLVVASVMLLPIGAGRFRLSRVEGIAFILLYLAYAAVATRTGAMAG
jgi:Ca2+/Na+ antiporter